ncbi:MAG: DUF4382 domain-containing protein [Candidatus Marinimicrobia bacterium]|nr:DUF4382 domain-containing protein [Candidatus Neomarinimicrobiota bacterium]MCF7829577.1 DUF4382 domain-containing protein [Candidatus Neomarinimicrobiota bacterium]MCF7882231.1 DUF4382 domain-containing protein [Candidatus Neomarinimicrobiota bacterium]
MKILKTISIMVLSAVFLISCSDSPTDSNKGTTGQMRVQAYDAPLDMDAEGIYLDIESVAVHKADGDSAEGWITVAHPDTTINFLDLVNGVRATLVDTALETGHYTQMRLMLSGDNTIEIGNEMHALTIPSSMQTGVKLNLDFTIEANEVVEIYLDFNAAKSVHMAPGVGYMLRPTFKAFKRDVSGTISGAVVDSADAAIQNASVYAVEGEDTTATVTDSTGAYMLTLPEGTYDLSAEAEGYSGSDTTYTGVELEAEEDLSGYDFQLME